ncbi:ketoacyl-ACP synthase III [Dasania sp. GY-MA-18]|uniref:Beta-ketoacyl-[acyl-carrier-protein] synthase III n=1 Tax=Dasania phycosphaerae TaxID=2950436 RepID=A0A9J6RPP1_9GAMM|nr:MULTISPECIES: ketoacyl-ACP synthase III [Dasania]MCR8923839.1 ketoacyl-ACP synthase III [Dasania sp. GY-MA-18]MCZ0866273.1 ketoacyl-ACP synthase III [Dasania phycosphaerae]MCZ0869997.1 ketoacyl-ACP synthase III [Dasania phycosphaerae]
MRYANITGWGKCLPPAILSNDDLATLLDTNDEWITTRTGMKERRISHVPVSSLATVAAARALACAGKQATDVELIIFGSTTFDEMCPNAASNVQKQLGAANAACMDVNTACTSGMYALTVATAMIKSGVVNNAIVIGAEVISTVMDWSNRNVAVLFGDGAGAFYLQADAQECGVIAESLGCYGESREILAVNGWGLKEAKNAVINNQLHWAFEGQEIFKKAVSGMDQACQKVLAKSEINADQIDLVVPHQANLRIIDTLAKRLKLPRDKVFINIQRYGNMSAATAPVALVEAIEEGRVKPNSLVLMPAFGGGLTWSAHLLRWGERTHSLGESDVELAPCNKTALELIRPN